MHTLVDMLYLSRREFERNLVGLSDEDARKRIEPMNCISWIIAHVANQHHAFFVAWPYGKEIGSQYKPYGYGQPASQPSLEEAMTLWHNACSDSEAWLNEVTDEVLRERPAVSSLERENLGALTVRCIFHTWCHLGEISSIRQVLGHQPPQFVDMRGWTYGGE
ncbi:MAG: DinB family protein [Dehalococcoidia bacterium]|jgi:uncharacterized damage-inducible protein DinB